MDRIFMLRFDDGEDFLEKLREVVIKENIRSGWLHVLGGIKEAGVVTGPREPTMPPDPVWKELSDSHEMLGGGSIFWDGEEPKIHLHAALGLHGDTLTGCVRKNTKTFLVLEVIIFEISGINASRPWFAKGGFNRLTFS